MTTKIEPLNDKSQWNDFIHQYGHGNLLQSWSWTEFQNAFRKNAWRLGMYEGEKLISICFAYLIKTKLRTHIYTSNGPVIDCSDPKKVEDILKIWIDYLGKVGAPEVGAKFVRLDPLLLNNSENLEMMKRLRLSKAAFSIQPEHKWILNIQPDEEILLANMRKNTRYAIRKSTKDGVTIEKSFALDEFEKFWTLYTQTFTRQEFIPFPKDYYQKQITTFNTEGSNSYLIFNAYYQGKVIASALFAFDNGMAYYLHAASDQAAKDLFAPYLIIWEAIQEAKRQRCTKFDFWGIAPENEPKHPWAGFSFFKKGFGGETSQVIPAFDLPTSKQYFAVKAIESTRGIWSKGLFVAKKIVGR